MANLLSGLRVLDLSQGVAGPMTAMLLADHGASVVRVDPPVPGAFAELPGYRVWNRGKRAVSRDLKTPEGARLFDELVASADVLVEAYAPATRKRLNLDYTRLSALNPRLVQCSISAYGEGNSHSERPGYDALVAARCGLHWEKRGWVGGGINRQAGLPPMFDDLEVPPGSVEGPERDGPLFFGLPLPSIGAFYLASTGIQAALYVRETTGRGQHVQTSLLQGAFSALIGGWQRIERTDMPFLQSWIFDGRAPLFNFRCKDGVWVHAWVPNPSWTLAMAELDSLDDAPDEVVAGTSHRDDPDRLGPDPENLVVVQYYHPLMAEAFAKFPAAEWLRAAARKGVPLQEVRPPAQALADPWWRKDGCVVELDDPAEGPIRMVGRTFSTGPDTGFPQAAAPSGTVDAAEIGWDAPRPPGTEPKPVPASPLAGVRVLDLGVAIAGPYGCQVLGDLGADVVKVNALHDGYWQSTHVAMTANRNKRSLAVNLKDPRGLAVLHRLVAEADVVQHNMRYDAAVRLGVDEATLRAIKPDLVYCHTRGFEQDGPRVGLPGNDQTGAALAGVEWEDGGVDDGGRPIWSRVNFGDTGNGFLSAIGIMQALAHRARTGEGARVDTSIVYAQLLAASGTFLRGDGTEPGRPRLDAGQFGLQALYRLYRCRDDRWLCLAAVTDAHWTALTAVLGDGGDEATAVRGLAGDPRFSDAASREANDAELAKLLEEFFATADAEDWAARLDAAGVPAEVSSETFSLGVFDDPEMTDRRWVAKFEHPYVGSFESIGLGIDFSETPGVLWGPPPVVGEHTPEVLREFGFTAEEITELTDAAVLRTWRPGEPVLPQR
ncbi:CoA transferase [Yinghuangia sp. YIM S09857]|uniref:CoA transferase n=1 Tax=Yinghuangia sp. YIM S09857 TaxID=3436929 RepID=UPI003F52DB25